MPAAENDPGRPTNLSRSTQYGKGVLAAKTLAWPPRGRAGMARYGAKKTGPAQRQVRSCCGISIYTVADLALQ
jgi:hypothetical protein